MPRTIHPQQNNTFAPVTQTRPTIGLEIEGLVSATRVSGTMEEKQTYRTPLAKAKYDLDQLVGSDATIATAEIVTDPFAVTEAGLKDMILAVQKAWGPDRPTKAVTFAHTVGDAFYTTATAQVKLKKGTAPGSQQTNLTISVERYFSSIEHLVPKATFLPRVAPIAEAAQDIVSDLITATTAPLYAHRALKWNLCLWVYQWLTRIQIMYMKVAKISGYAKDLQGMTIKSRCDPVSNDIPYAAATIMTGLLGPTGVKAPELESMYTKAEAAVKKSLNLSNVTVPDEAVDLLTDPDTPASERPLNARTINGELCPIVEIRKMKSPLNAMIVDYRTPIVPKNQGNAAEAAKGILKGLKKMGVIA